MHKKIFFRYFNACALIILVTMIVLATVTTGVFTIQNVRDQDRRMENAAQQVASMLEGMPSNYTIFVGSVMRGSIETVKKTLECEVIIVNKRGDVMLTTLPATSEPVLSNEALLALSSGETYRKLGVFIEEMGESYTIGVPILSEKGDSVGAVYTTARQVRINSQMQEIMVTFLVCGVSVMLIAFVFVYFITKQIVRPLNEISLAAQSYVKGDFSRRITVGPEGEINDLAITFNRMADGLEQLEVMRRGFIADISHELRTPMTTIGGFVDGILDGTIPPQLQEKYLLLVSGEVKRLARLVNELLDVARIQSGEISYKMDPFCITEVAYQVLLSMEDRIREGEIQLRVQIPEEELYALGDGDAIHRVLYNLMDNAVKFTPPHGEIALSLYPEGKKFYLAVRNTGKGIPEPEVGRIFERFYKTDKSRGENKKGVGLGLYMVKNIIDAHGEDITVNSKEGSYAEFSFSLTRAEEE